MQMQPRRLRRLQTKRAARQALRGKMNRRERCRAFHRLWANLMVMSRGGASKKVGTHG